MIRFLTAPRALTLLCGAAVALTAVGCGSQPNTGPKVSEQERQEMIRRDAEQMQKERLESQKRPR